MSLPDLAPGADAGGGGGGGGISNCGNGGGGGGGAPPLDALSAALLLVVGDRTLMSLSACSGVTPEGFQVNPLAKFSLT